MSEIRWHIGCSGFNYPSWKYFFYPAKSKPADWLQYYATKFDTVELNSTFYKFPVVKNLSRLYDITPSHFIFSVKAHKIITHSMRMNNAATKIAEFTDIIENGLKDKLACILFQLPPSFKYSEENLERIVSHVPHQSRNVIEFRHISWWKNKTFSSLRKSNLTFCDVSFPGLSEAFKATTEKYYLRMHGVPVLFQSSYDSESIEQIFQKIPVKAKARFVYFNNTTYEAALQNALLLRKKTIHELISK